MLDSGFVLSYVSTGGIDPSGFNLGLLGFEFSNLDFAGGEVITNVVLQPGGSTWPDDTFDDVTFGPHSISIDVSQPTVYLYNLDSSIAAFAITTPELDASSAAGAVVVTLAAIRRRRAER